LRRSDLCCEHPAFLARRAALAGFSAVNSDAQLLV
jgi:hypothetical protein